MNLNLGRILVLGLLALRIAGSMETLPTLRKATNLHFKVPGNQQKTLADFGGKVVALEFIQTTCPHCQAASKVMTQLQRDLGARGFQAIDLAINTANEADINAFKMNQQTDFLVGWTDFYQMGAFLGITPGTRFVVPQVVLIDREGNIRYQTPATGDEQATELSSLQPRITSLLQAKH